ncbi:hypothetical protein SAMN05421540_106168 [Psychroflexus halocasei]|uniref:Uncharacterized protein n=1 Tax=Psychroflexus halocasei TaxID=908615 RepID=A0A1H4BUN5_9FLAO|nr:hypothetical protein SAMN05421540_106168 [Psychroflexus halocasei]
MKKNKNQNIVKGILLVVFILLIVAPSMAQIPLPGGGEEGPGDTPAPIDGLIGVAIAVGAVAGVRRLRKKEN